MTDQNLTVEPAPGQTVTVEAPAPEASAVAVAESAVALAETVAAGAEVDASIRMAEHADDVRQLKETVTWQSEEIRRLTDLSGSILGRLDAMIPATQEIAEEVAAETTAETMAEILTPPQSSEETGSLETMEPEAVITETISSETETGNASVTATVHGSAAQVADVAESLAQTNPAQNRARQRRWL